MDQLPPKLILENHPPTSPTTLILCDEFFSQFSPTDVLEMHGRLLGVKVAHPEQWALHDGHPSPFPIHDVLTIINLNHFLSKMEKHWLRQKQFSGF